MTTKRDFELRYFRQSVVERLNDWVTDLADDEDSAQHVAALNEQIADVDALLRRVEHENHKPTEEERRNIGIFRFTGVVQPAMFDVLDARPMRVARIDMSSERS